MSTDFTRENPALSKEIESAKSPEELSAVLLRYQELHGMATRYDRVALPGSVGTSSSQPRTEPLKDDGRQLLRRAVTLDNGTIHCIEAYSVGGLDALETSLRTGRIW